MLERLEPGPLAHRRVIFCVIARNLGYSDCRILGIMSGSHDTSAKESQWNKMAWKQDGWARVLDDWTSCLI